MPRKPPKQFDRKELLKNPNRALWPEEVAFLFKCSAKTVNRWAHEGRIEHLRTTGGHVRIRARVVLEILGTDEDILTVKEVANLFRLRQGTIRGKTWRRELPPLRSPGGDLRYHESQVEELLRKRSS